MSLKNQKSEMDVIYCHLCLNKVKLKDATYVDGWVDVENSVARMALIARGYHLEENPLNIIGIKLHHYVCKSCYEKIKEALYPFHRSISWHELRMSAYTLYSQGKTVSEVSAMLGISPELANEYYAAWSELSPATKEELKRGRGI
jgi:transposase-like protein